MCLDGNNAPHSAHYINAQLTALYENSEECVAHHAHGLKAHERVRFDFALAEFFYSHRGRVAAVEDMLFAAEFHRPELEFVCNHEVIIRFHIHNGHLNLDYAKSVQPGFSPSRDRNVTLNDVEVAFRVPFSTSGIAGSTSKIGNGVHVIKLMILDTTKARLASHVHVQDGHIRDALVFYMTKYIAYLQRAGRHVFYSLPDFDNDGKELLIDYSSTCKPEYLNFEGIDFRGVSIEKINSNLSSAWLQAAMLAERYAEGDVHIGYESVCLAEYRSTWTTIGNDTGFQFKIMFDAPRVKMLCDREAVLYFKIGEVSFFDTDDFTHEPRQTYENLEIAFLVDLVYEVNSEGIIVDIRFDLTQRRFCEHLTFYGEVDETAETFYDYRDTLIHFFNEYYFSILKGAKHHIIYTHTKTTTTITIDVDREIADWRAIDLEKHKESISIIREERITKTQMFGFDYIQAITQSSIVDYFESIWRHAEGSTLEYLGCLTKWSYDQYFESSFGPIRVRLLSNDKAIVWIHLQEGHLHTLKNRQPFASGNPNAFSDWHLAFEVDIKMVDHEDLVAHCGSWATRFKDSPAAKHHSQQGHVHLTHIILDFSTAEFVYDLCNFHGLFEGGGRHAIALLQAAIHYMKHHYFPVLVNHGHHVLHTIPVWGSRLDIPAYGLTSIRFQIYSKEKYTRHNCLNVSPFFQPVIMILGMCDFRDWPREHLEYSAEWVIAHERITHGTVAISRQRFFEECLLEKLAIVNKSTAIVPTFSGVESGEWQLEVATWLEHDRKRNSSVTWQLVKESHEAMEYKWEHGDEWTYEHHGMSRDTNNGIYWVRSHTRNDLTIPTSFKHGGLEIKLKGQVTLEIGFKSHEKQWSTKAVASWNTIMAFVSEHSGVGIRVYGETRPAISTSHVHSELINTRFTALKKLLETHLPSKIDLADLAQELQSSFCGEWKLCYPGLGAYCLTNPVFNRHGDILFETRPVSVSPGIHPRVGMAGAVGRGLPSPLSSRPGSRQPSYAGARTPPRSPRAAQSPSTGPNSALSPLKTPVDFTQKAAPSPTAAPKAASPTNGSATGNGAAPAGPKLAEPAKPAGGVVRTDGKSAPSAPKLAEPAKPAGGVVPKDNGVPGLAEPAKPAGGVVPNGNGAATGNGAAPAGAAAGADASHLEEI